MNKQSFTCPNCGAPLDAPDSDETTIRCPFCETSVIVPEELRRPPKMQFIELNNQVDFTPRMVEFNRQPKSNKSGLWIMLAVMCVFGLGLVILVLPKLVGQTTDNALYQASGLKPTSTVKPIKTATPIQTPTHPPSSRLLPAPCYLLEKKELVRACLVTPVILPSTDREVFI